MSLAHIVLLAACFSQAPEEQGSESSEGLDTGGPDTGDSGELDDTSTDSLEGRCYTELMELTGTLAPDDLLLDSISEVHCQGGQACYEHIALYDDGVVVYQNILLTGVNLDCLVLDMVSEQEMLELDASVATLMSSDGIWSELTTPCERNEPQADAFGVDTYRARREPGFVFPFAENLTCRGLEGATDFKLRIDAWWGMATREIDALK
jgi:hypothetical protein